MTIADALHDCVQDNLRYLDDKKSSHPTSLHRSSNRKSDGGGSLA